MQEEVVRIWRATQQTILFVTHSVDEATYLADRVAILTRRPARRNVAMTGELTLSGRILPIGGVKEKVLAAHRAGIRTILLPKWNKKDIEDLPPKVRREVTFHFVDEMMDVLKLALDK
jgi:ATP-dependent Lon protease